MECGISLFFLNYEIHVMQEISLFISYTVYTSMGLWNSTAEPKFTVFDSTKPPPRLWILSPQWNFTIPHSNDSINLTLIQYEGGGKTIYSTICPQASVSITFSLLDYNKNSWIRLKAKIPRFLYNHVSSCCHGRLKEQFFFFLNGKIWFLLSIW